MSEIEKLVDDVVLAYQQENGWLGDCVIPEVPVVITDLY